MKTNRKLIQITSIVGVSLLVLFIYLQQKNDSFALTSSVSDSFTNGSDVSNWDFNINSIIEDLLESDTLSPEIKKGYELLLANDTTNELLLMLATSWEEKGHGLLAGYYYEKLALRSNEEGYWQKAGNNFFELQDRVNDSTIRSTLSSHSILAYQKVLELNPNNLDAKADLAVCLLESGSAPPMQAVGLLKEVLQVDSNHIKGIFYLGFFSMQSTQYAKAAQRFERLSQLDASNPIYYQYWAQALALSGEKKQAIAVYQKHKSMLSDPTAISDVDIIIERLQKEL